MTDSETLLTPDQVGDVQELRPQQSEDVKLTPETRVLCIHRGRTPLEDMFDSQHYVISPGYFTTEYGAAKHFKDRSVVPGSRNPETQKQASFIAILGVPQVTTQGIKMLKVNGRAYIDHPDQWPAFTDQECAKFGLATEALDRAAMTDPILRADETEVVRISGAATAAEAVDPGTSRVTSAGGNDDGGRRPRNKIEGTGKALLKPGRTDENEATRQIRQDRAEAQNSHE